MVIEMEDAMFEELEDIVKGKALITRDRTEAGQKSIDHFPELSGMVTSQTVPLTFGILVDRLQSITRYYTKRTSAFATQYCEKADHQVSLRVFIGHTMNYIL